MRPEAQQETMKRGLQARQAKKVAEREAEVGVVDEGSFMGQLDHTGVSVTKADSSAERYGM